MNSAACDKEPKKAFLNAFTISLLKSKSSPFKTTVKLLSSLYTASIFPASVRCFFYYYIFLTSVHCQILWKDDMWATTNLGCHPYHIQTLGLNFPLCCLGNSWAWASVQRDLWSDESPFSCFTNAQNQRGILHASNCHSNTAHILSGRSQIRTINSCSWTVLHRQHHPLG